jgi:hypothetical protein
VIRNIEGSDEAELIMMRWGMPRPPRTGGPPVTNIRNTSSPHWRGWLKPESRCLVPANSFAEYAPEPNPETKKKDVVWFAFNDARQYRNALKGTLLPRFAPKPLIDLMIVGTLNQRVPASSPNAPTIQSQLARDEPER